MPAGTVSVMLTVSHQSRLHQWAWGLVLDLIIMPLISPKRANDLAWLMTWPGAQKETHFLTSVHHILSVTKSATVNKLLPERTFLSVWMTWGERLGVDSI